jgi:hypothetical protein
VIIVVKMEKQKRDAEDRRTKLQQPRVNHAVMPIGLWSTSELSWRKPWDGLRDEGQMQARRCMQGILYGEACVQQLFPVACIEIHPLSLILSSLIQSFILYRSSDPPRRKTIDPIASSCRHVGAYRFPDQPCASATCLPSDHCFAFSLLVANPRLVERYLFCPQG